MKAISILKLLLSIMFYMMILGLVANILQITMLFIERDRLNSLLILTDSITIQLSSLTNQGKLHLSLLMLVKIAFAYILYLFIKIFKDFSKYKFFSNLVITKFKQIGYLLIFTTIIQNIVGYFFIKNFKTPSELNVLYDFSYLFDNRFSNIIIGLIFIGFSYVLNVAKDYKKNNLKLEEENIELKQENELTI